MSLTSASLGVRVAHARQRAGLKQEELARAVGIERSAVAKIETGARRVTALELARIAEAVDERIEWFIEDAPPAIVSHRNLADPGEPSPRIDATVDRIVRAVEFVGNLDSGLHEALVAMPPFDEPTTATETEALALEARALLNLDPFEPLHELSTKLASVGVLSFVVDLGSESADAASVLLPAGAVAVVNGALRTGRRRLSLAHEFGHVLIADEYTVDWRVDNSTAPDRREHVLDRFARALLLPEASLTEKWKTWGGAETNTLRDAATRTASHFRVDMSTLARRLVDIGLITESQAAFVRTIKTSRADIVEHNLLVADELPVGELPRVYEAAVLRLYTSETISEVRALDLLLETWNAAELPPLARRNESEIWQFTS